MPRGTLNRLYRACLARVPESSRLPDNCLGASGLLGVFDYVAGSREGSMCLFLPDSHERLGGRAKLRLGPGKAEADGELLTFVPDEGNPHAWLIDAEVNDAQEVEEFLYSAASADRVVGHLLAP